MVLLDQLVQRVLTLRLLAQQAQLERKACKAIPGQQVQQALTQL